MAKTHTNALNRRLDVYNSSSKALMRIIWGCCTVGKPGIILDSGSIVSEEKLLVYGGIIDQTK